MDDLLVKLSELADPKLTVESSDNGKILFEMSYQFEPVLPCAAKRPKMDSKANDSFAAIVTSAT